ncbi:indolepyruvate oxidoreductase subunit beta [Acidianus sp. HS-5]|uniref:indolepyruvate oxidoreductase subunit beta n=1 Tax=Acidianus sp. HS-5 TaxID=2886040 RepID=UPI001F382CEE|nr:indolepyruvate oxidoreductase subunit beta [Acidianus sp. HS-5]BDC19476.1 indolepyruvate oxidoreductase [Acidianus sp. HS-5]
MVKLNILVAGVGGQGIITMGKMITNACEREGIKVLVAETHGLAQRGGAVNIHVRIGDVYAPIIAKHGADCLIGLEANEVLRNLDYANSNTIIVLNEYSLKPVLPKVKENSVEEIVKKLSNFRVFRINANNIASLVGDKRVVNSAILGFAYGLGIFRMMSEESFTSTLKGENNVKAFRLGLEESLKLSNKLTI